MVFEDTVVIHAPVSEAFLFSGEHGQIHELILGDLGSEQAGGSPKPLHFQANWEMACDKDPSVPAPIRLPAMMKWSEIALVLTGQDGTKAGRVHQMERVVLALYPKLRRHVNQMARRSKLTGHSFVNQAVIKVQGHHGAPLSPRE